MMRPCHRFVPFVEANKEWLSPRMLCSHAEYPLTAEIADHVPPQLSRNPSPEARAILEANPDKIDWKELSTNPSHWALAMMRANPNKVFGYRLAHNRNEEALQLFDEHSRLRDMGFLWGNPTETAMRMMLADPDRIIEWDMLSMNSHPEALRMLLANPEKIDWCHLGFNVHPEAVALLATKPEEIEWSVLSQNSCPDAMAMVEANVNKVSWLWLSLNPAIFELDHAQMRANMRPMREELLRNRMHPSRMRQAERDWLLL
jgi:hypothetical protein